MSDLLTIKEASKWASEHLKKQVTSSNISYLVQYGCVKKHGSNGSVLVRKDDLELYYSANNGTKSDKWKKKLGNDLNWALSFDNYRESETTKHVHRLHPYKGKFIPQLVEYFLDQRTDSFKKESYFKPNDLLLDPFCGSGTTLVQANELGMHAIGIDVSAFNTLISNIKIKKHDLIKLKFYCNNITKALHVFVSKNKSIEFEEILLSSLFEFNSKYFPSPEYRFKVRNKEINEKEYSITKEKEFLSQYYHLINAYKIKIEQKKQSSFLDKWYIPPIRKEIDFVFKQIQNIEEDDIRKILAVILSRTIRSCRATTHSDLATLFEPVNETYYCSKHRKICKPLFTIFNWWNRYSIDTIKRLQGFNDIKTHNTSQLCVTGDSRIIDIQKDLYKKNRKLYTILKENKINGIFSSPPYVGLIDYHEQHAYAYDLFNFDRNDESEIGPLYKGQGREARESYVEGISKVLINCKKYFTDDYNVFLVANDKYNLYPTIAEKSNMKIVNSFKRPVLNRTEKNKTAYSEIIFHMKEK